MWCYTTVPSPHTRISGCNAYESDKRQLYVAVLPGFFIPLKRR